MGNEGESVVIIIIMKLWPAPWSWYMYLGTCSARAAAPDLEAAEAELAAATRAGRPQRALVVDAVLDELLRDVEGARPTWRPGPF